MGDKIMHNNIVNSVMNSIEDNACINGKSQGEKAASYAREMCARRDAIVRQDSNIDRMRENRSRIRNTESHKSSHGIHQYASRSNAYPTSYDHADYKHHMTSNSARLYGASSRPNRPYGTELYRTERPYTPSVYRNTSSRCTDVATTSSRKQVNDLVARSHSALKSGDVHMAKRYATLAKSVSDY